MKFELAIFDMDGVLVDSEVHWAAAGPQIWDKLGIKYTKDIERGILGLNVRDSTKFINAKYGYKIAIRDARQVYKSFRKLIYTERSQLLPGVMALIDELKKNKVKIALASGASFESIERVMDKHNMHNYFEVKFSTADMRFPGKPDPAIYNAVMRKFKVSPRQTAIFEDALPGVQSGKASGAKVIAIPHNISKHNDFSIADLVVKSLADNKVYKFLGLKI